MKKSWNSIAAWMEFTAPQPSQRAALQQNTSPRSRTRVPKASPNSMRQAIGHVSVILPVYNEQACIRQTFEVILRYLAEHPNFTFIFVNDGSTDRTKQILKAGIRIAKTQHVHLISYSPHVGKGYAIQCGVEYADGDLICFLDSDLAYSLSHLDVLVETLKTCDLAIGSRTQSSQREVKLSRRVARKIFNLLCRQILNLQYADTQAGLKGFRENAAKNLFRNQQLTGFSFDAELIYLAQKWGYTIAEIPAKVSKKHQTKVSQVNLLQDSIKMLLDLLKIRFNDQLGRYP